MLNVTNRTARRTVLVVEDDELDYAYLDHCLRRALGAHVEIEWVQSVSDADRLLETKTYDVVVLDYHVGNRTPVSLVRHWQATATRPLVVLVSSAPPSTLSVMSAGIDNVVTLDKTSLNAHCMHSAFQNAGVAMH